MILLAFFSSIVDKI